MIAEMSRVPARRAPNPVPRGRIAARVFGVIAALLVIYNTLGEFALRGILAMAQAWGDWRGLEVVSASYESVDVSGIAIEGRLYWLASAATLFAIALFVLRGRPWPRIFLGTLAGVVIVTATYSFSVVVAIELAARNWAVAPNITSGTFALVVSIAVFMVAFAAQVGLGLSGKETSAGRHSGAQQPVVPDSSHRVSNR